MDSFLCEADPTFDSPRSSAFESSQGVEGYDVIGSRAINTSRKMTASQMREYTVEPTSEPTQLERNALGFLPLSEWDEYNSYDEEVPSRLRYSIEWKVAVNNRVVARDTEQDLALAPAAHWHMYLKAKVEKLLAKKLAGNRHVECDDTKAIVSVNDRAERDLTKRFDNMDIDWSIVERQLLRWGELFRSGKRLRVDLSFNYIDTAPQASTGSRGSKRGSSATQKMLADRAAQLDAEQETDGSPSAWQEVYALMRCPGPPCDLGPHCWRDPFGKKHYKLRTHHLRALVELVQQGYSLKSHGKVPEDIRQQLYTEEQQRRERQSAAASVPTPSLPPITITNVLPAPTHGSPAADSGNSISAARTHISGSVHLDIPGRRDEAVIAYSKWQQSNVADETLKEEVQNACDAALEDGLDLEQIHEDQDPGFFVNSGVKRGIARRFVSDIDGWAKRYKLSYDP